MKVLKVFGEHDPALQTMTRVSVRGILFNQDGTLHMVSTERYRDCSFPGGGVEKGETDAEALCRELREEAGYEVDPVSIRPFGQVDIIRPDLYKPEMEFYQINRYYLCEGRRMWDPAPSENEKEEGIRAIDISIEEAIVRNKAIEDDGYCWIARELIVLEALKKEMEKTGKRVLTKEGRSGILVKLSGAGAQEGGEARKGMKKVEKST